MSAKGKSSADRFEKIPLAQLEEYIRTGDESLMTEKLRLFADQLNTVRQALERYETENEILRLLDVTYPGMSVRTRKQLYADCLNFYYIDTKVKKSAWKNILAQKLEAIFSLAIELGDVETARKAVVSQADILEVNVPDIKEDETDPLRNDLRPVIITAQPSLVGMAEINRDEVLRQVKEFKLSKADFKRVTADLDPDAPLTNFEDEAEEQ